VYCALDAGFQSRAELRIAARFFAVESALHEDEFGDGAHPGFADAKRPYAWLFVQGNQAPLAHRTVRGPWWSVLCEPKRPLYHFFA
jgi:hypothetical protein